jgi:hypothetical protein
MHRWRPLRTVEGRQKPITRGVDLAAAEPRQLSPNPPVMRLQQLPPRTITQLAGPFRGTNDVGEQHRREEAIKHGILVLHRGEKCLDLLDRPVDVSDPGEVVRTGKLHCDGAWHVLGEVASSAANDLAKVPSPQP